MSNDQSKKKTWVWLAADVLGDIAEWQAARAAAGDEWVPDVEATEGLLVAAGRLLREATVPTAGSACLVANDGERVLFDVFADDRAARAAALAVLRPLVGADVDTDEDDVFDAAAEAGYDVYIL